MVDTMQPKMVGYTNITLLPDVMREKTTPLMVVLLQSHDLNLIMRKQSYKPKLRDSLKTNDLGSSKIPVS